MADSQMAEVRSGLFFGSRDVANDRNLLKSSGVTHVINLVSDEEIERDGIRSFPNEFTYCNLPMFDFFETRIIDFFVRTNNFIQKVLQEGGKVFVHCNMGRSRAATIMAAYLMKTEGLGADQALDQIRAIRWICPNHGFVQQLHEYEEKLRR